MASLFEQINSFLRAERSQQAFHESLRALSDLRPAPPIRTSLTFDSHIEEARGGGSSGKSKMPRNISLAWDDANFYGIQDVASRNWQSLTPRERKDILLNIYLNNPWVSACVDVIAKRITSGGVSIEPLVDKPDEGHLHQLEDFCLRVNDDWDILQYVRACITDELIYGDAYSETVWQKGLPYQLYKVDCLTMGYKTNRYGQITEFLQQMDTSREPQVLDSRDIIRWWFPHPRSAVEPFSPIERAQDAVNLDKKMVNWLTTFFQKGAKFPYYVKFPGEQDEADRFLQWFKQNFTGEKNAHVPLVTWGGAELVPLGKGSMDIDFEHGSDRERLIILATYHVPPAILSIIESGNLGGGTGEDQEKSFQYNTCDPIRHMFFEKFNYRIVQGGFNIHDYRVSTRYADYRNDKDLATVQEIRIKSGAITMNEARQEMGKMPYPKGGDIPVIITPKEVTPVPRLDMLEDEQTKTMQQQLDQGDLNTEMLKVKVDQAKNPPPPMPGMPGQPQQGAAQQQPQGKQQKGKQESAEQHTGMMIAFMLDAENAAKLAIPGGEPVDNLHITLAFLGKSTDYKPEEIEQIKSILANFAYNHNSLSGTTSGIGKFAASDSSDGKSPVIALVNVPGIQELRADLVKALNSSDFTVADDFEYTPHITLTYVQDGTPAPVETIPELTFRFRELCLVVGDNHYYYRLDTSEESQIAEFNPNHDAKGQFAPGSSVSVEYRGFTKVPPAVQQTVNDAIAKSSQHAAYPDNLKVIVHNQKPTSARGYYTHKDQMVGKTVVAHGPAINTFIKGQTMAEIEWNIAHEFGHADHMTRHPESEKWSSDQQEAHAQKMAQKITGRV